MFNKSDYQKIGLMKKWEVIRLEEWRGWQIAGSNGESPDEVIAYFLPDAAVRVLVEESEKPPSARQNKKASN